jgi:hypothetical protein
MTYDQIWEKIQNLSVDKQAGVLNMVFGWMRSCDNKEFLRALNILFEKYFAEVKIG